MEHALIYREDPKRSLYCEMSMARTRTLARTWVPFTTKKAPIVEPEQEGRGKRMGEGGRRSGSQTGCYCILNHA
jgi:hypothetical protein